MWRRVVSDYNKAHAVSRMGFALYPVSSHRLTGSALSEPKQSRFLRFYLRSVILIAFIALAHFGQ